MDLIGVKSIAGKYFINIQSSGKRRRDQFVVCHGRVLGPISHEMSMAYLVELYPTTTATFDITTQSVLSLDALLNAQFFDSHDDYLACWRQISARIAEADETDESVKLPTAEARKLRKRRLLAHLRGLAEILRTQGIKTVYIGQIDELRDCLALKEQRESSAGIAVEQVEQVERTLDEMD